jgi:hypothetical protein
MEKAVRRRKTGDFIKIKQLAKVCEKYNITRVVWENIELEFGDKPKRSSKAVTKYESDSGKYLESPNLDMPPDDVLLFAATPHFENILEDRKAAKKG